MVKIDNIKHRLYMPPMKKYEVYGKFPWKLVIQILLVAATTSQIMLIVNQNTTYSYNQYTLWNKLFLNKDADGSDTSITNSYNIFGINQLKQFISKSVDKYYDINSYTIDDYKYHYEDDGTKEAPKLLVEYYDNDKALDKGYEIQYKLYSNDLGPFSKPDMQDFMEQVKRFEIDFSLEHKLDKHIKLASNCYNWYIKQKFDFAFHGVITTSLGTDRKNCIDEDRNVLKNYFWIDICVLFLALCSLATIVNYIHKRLELVSQIAGNQMNSTKGVAKAWEQLRISDKLQFFNFWIIIAILGNLFQIFGGILSIINRSTTLKVYEIIVGFGCFFAWIGSLRFLDHRSHSYTIVDTVSRSAKTIFLYIIGVLPIFMGYAFLGICSFWKTGIFPSTPMSLLANYAVVNGDSVYNFSLATFQENSFLGQAYYYTFVVFFICCVHNLFIAIVERSFSSLKDNPRIRGDESSDEESNESLKDKEKIKKMQSKQALNRILNSGKNKNRVFFDENTLVKVQDMNAILDDFIVNDFKKLMKMIEVYQKGSKEFEAAKDYLLSIIEYRFMPVLDNFL